VAKQLGLLAAVVVLAAVLRFWGIGDQSYWLDEAYTVQVIDRGFGDMLAEVPHTESTPPLYYILAWLWSQVFGVGEAGLRSLSAVLGIATVPAAYLAGRQVFSERAGLIAALLVAVNPYLVWFSQEARAYALFVLLATLSVWLLARAVDQPTTRRTLSWAAIAALAICTHYFAGFLVLGEMAWLIWRVRSRAAAIAAGLVVLVVAALAPLPLHQRTTGHLDFIDVQSLPSRISDLPKKFVSGELGTPTPVIGALAALAAAVAIAWLVLRGDRDDRRGALLVGGLAAAVVGLPVLLAALGPDYALTRNLIVVIVLGALAVGAGCAVAGRAGIALAAVIALVAVVVNVQVTRDDELQRDDWRAAAERLGPATGPRAVVITPDLQAPGLEHYAGDMDRVEAAGATVSEVAVIAYARPANYTPPPPPPGFRPVDRAKSPSWDLIRYRADAATPVTYQALAAARLGPKGPAILVQAP
jgi:uncharacterized membrane protein